MQDLEMKIELLQMIREQLAKDIRELLNDHFEFNDTFEERIKCPATIKDNEITYELLHDQYLVVDLVNQQFFIEQQKFDFYRDPCPGFVFEYEKDVTDKCLPLIGSLSTIIKVFTDDTVTVLN